MRFFTLLITAFAVIISVNASILQTPEVLSTYENCSNNITMLTKKIEMIKIAANDVSALYAFGRSIFKIFTPYSYLKFKRSDYYCCQKFAPNMTSEEANTISAFLPSAIDEYDGLVSALIIKKSIIEKDENSLLLAKGIPHTLHIIISNLSKCLASKSLVNGISTDTALLEKLNNIDSKIKAAYGPVKKLVARYY